MDEFNYGENLRIIRQTKGISQEAMAYNLKISQATYSRIESQAFLPDSDRNSKIAKVLNVPPLQLLPDGEISTYNYGPKRNGYYSTQIKEFLNTPIGLVMLFGGAYAVLNTLNIFNNYICAHFGASETARITVGWLAALLTIVCYFYWVFKAAKRNKL